MVKKNRHDKREREFSALNFTQRSRDWRFNKINSTNRSSITLTEEVAGNRELDFAVPLIDLINENTPQNFDNNRELNINGDGDIEILDNANLIPLVSQLPDLELLDPNTKYQLNLLKQNIHQSRRVR